MITRRELFGTSVGFCLAWESVAHQEFKTKLQPSLFVGRANANALERLRDAGFEGIETKPMNPKSAEALRAAAEKLGMKIHSVMRGWASFNDKDRKKADASLAATEDALHAARAYGADAVLLVPCRIDAKSIPAPWEFKLDFDPATGHLNSVVEGDNAPYREFIKAHNHAEDASREYIRRLLPLAEETKVIVAVENVWNILWVRPEHFRNFVDSFKSPWVKAYFDIGNHAKYGPPEEWLEVLGELVVRCHVKDFKIDRTAKNGGRFVAIREGCVDWPAVRRAIEKIGYNGWMTIEGGRLKSEEACERLGLISSGK